MSRNSRRRHVAKKRMVPKRQRTTSESWRMTDKAMSIFWDSLDLLEAGTPPQQVAEHFGLELDLWEFTMLMVGGMVELDDVELIVPGLS